MNHPRFVHLGVAVPDLWAAIPLYESLFGYRPRARPTDDPLQGVSVCFLETGDSTNPVIELVAPLGDKSPVTTLLSKNRAGAYHMCFEVDDLDSAMLRFHAERCVIVANPVAAAAFEGRRIGWIYTPTRQLIELLERPKIAGFRSS